MSKKINILKIKAGIQIETIDFVAIESVLNIKICNDNNRPSEIPFSITMRTPGFDSYLAIGFLFTEALINSSKDIVQFKLEKDEIVLSLKPSNFEKCMQSVRSSFATSSCGVCGKTSIESYFWNQPPLSSTIQLLYSDISIFYSQMAQKSIEFEATGGSHSAALFNSQGVIMCTFEDVGRHNALDKCAGFILMENDAILNRKILILSGRASWELVQKARRLNCEIVISKGAPSSLAIEMASKLNITLCGFYSEQTQTSNIYCHPERMIF